MTRQEIQNEVAALRAALIAWDKVLYDKHRCVRPSGDVNEQLTVECYELRQDLIAKHGYRDAPGTEMKLIVP